MTTTRDWALEAIKRPALRWLHRTSQGEAWLVRVYLAAEQQAERVAPWEPLPASSPPWLGRWLDQHRVEEGRHAALFAAHLRSLGAEITSPSSPDHGFDWLSRRKLRDLRRLVDTFAPRFAAGAVVPALTIAWRMEEMGVRVFARHREVLAAHAPGAALLPLLGTVLADERRHARVCARGLDRLVAPAEKPAWDAVRQQVDRIERRGGVLGALALLLGGVCLWIRSRIASSISPWRTDAAT